MLKHWGLFLTLFTYLPLLQLPTASSLSIINSKNCIVDMFKIPNLWYQLSASNTWRPSYVYNFPRLSVHKILPAFPVTHHLHQLNTKRRTHSMRLTSILITQIAIRVASPRSSLNFHFIRNRITGIVIMLRAGQSGIRIPIWAKTFLRNVQTSLGPTQLPIKYRSYLRGAKRPGLLLTFHLHLPPRLRTNGAIPLFSAGMDKNNCNFYCHHWFDLTRMTVCRWGSNGENCHI
jgi:hypothetical protein